jgi:hypothetical protein
MEPNMAQPAINEEQNNLPSERWGAQRRAPASLLRKTPVLPPGNEMGLAQQSTADYPTPVPNSRRTDRIVIAYELPQPTHAAPRPNLDEIVLAYNKNDRTVRAIQEEEQRRRLPIFSF